ncbi:spinster family MFS transporter [Henriciella litoralis]|uniref:spinster family MFS transporter n=1 Tax=Henriciella litoralis TaxID=568102 RepID=UPI000A0020B6|nr:MFS transporter [Henriciella litoralis]
MNSAFRGADPRPKYVLAILTITFVLANIDRNIINMLLEQIRAEFDLLDWQLGLLSGFAFSAVYAIAGVWISRLADRGDRITIISISLTVWSAMTALCGMAGSAIQLMLARAGVGLGEGGCSPPAHSLISDLFPASKRATALGIYASGATVGLAGGFYLGGWLGEAFGWRVALLAVGLPGLFVAILFRLTVKEPRRSVEQVQSQTAPKQNLVDAALRIWRSRSLRHVMVAAALSAMVASGTITFVPSFLIRTHDMTTLEVGTALAVITGVFASSGVIFGGWVADRLARRDQRWNAWIPALAKLLALPGMLIFFLIDNKVFALAAYALPSFLSGMWLGPTYSMVQGLAPKAIRSTAAAVLLLVYNILGLGVGPIIIGGLSDFIRDVYGGNSLRTALLCIAPISCWAAFHYWWSARFLREDMKNPDLDLELAEVL